MDQSSRRTISVLIRIGLVCLAIVLVAGWVTRHVHVPGRRHMKLQTVSRAPTALGAGDYRLYNVDSSVDVTLMGNRILTGLSPKTVAEIRGKLASSRDGDTSDLGRAIAGMVKQTIANNIDTHAAFNVADIRDVRFVDGRLVFDWRNDSHETVLGEHMKVNGKEGNRFRRDEAERFIAAFRARKAELAR